MRPTHLTRLRLLRLRRGLTALAASREACLDRSMYSKVELARLYPPVRVVAMLEKLYGLPFKNLMESA